MASNHSAIWTNHTSIISTWWSDHIQPYLCSGCVGGVRTDLFQKQQTNIWKIILFKIHLISPKWTFLAVIHAGKTILACHGSLLTYISSLLNPNDLWPCYTQNRWAHFTDSNLQNADVVSIHNMCGMHVCLSQWVCICIACVLGSFKSPLIIHYIFSSLMDPPCKNSIHCYSSM